MNWARRNLGDLCSIITKGSTPTSYGMAYASSGIPFLRVQNLDNGLSLDGDVLFISEDTHEAFARSQIQPKDVLLSIAGTIGRSAIVPDNASPLNCNQAVAIIRINGPLERRYLRHWFQTHDAQEQMRGAQVTATISNLSLIQDRKLEVPLPPPEEQRRITAILDQSETLRAKRRHALDKFDRLTQACFQDLFGDPLSNPKKWNKTTVGEIAPFISSGVTPLGGSSVYQSSGILFIRSQNVLMNAVDFSDAAFVSPELHQQMKRSWVKRGDVLLNITGASIGRVHYFSGEDGTANVNQHVCIIRADQKRILPAFLARFLSAPSYQAQIVGQNSGATRQAFNFEQIRRFEIFIPPMELQARFVKQEALVASLRNKYTASLTKLDSLFASLQHRAFQGEL
ncbi:MAG: restriction endonuclease subunit S [Verrucomicrobia bacterium]|nr:restriction endonuclease subunit S [Verrucomicrobiota bacterium]